jgi:cytoskeletal protein CcmA (bactofilin family)
MLSKNIIHKSTSLALTIAIFCVYSMVALAGTKDITGEITVTGQVTVNGQTVVSNSTVVSGSIVATSANSTAVVSLGKTGRLELLPESSITLRFTDGSITGILSAGKVRVSNAAGVATTITTKDAVAIADAGQADTFVVETECSHTHVDTMSGLVTLRTGNSDKQVAAGTDATAGNLNQAGCKPCLRPNPNPGVFPVAGSGWLAPLLIAAAGGAAAAILLGSNGVDDVTIGGNTTVVSGVR